MLGAALTKAYKAAKKDGRLRFVFATGIGYKITLKDPKLFQRVLAVSGNGTCTLITNKVWGKVAPLLFERRELTS